MNRFGKWNARFSIIAAALLHGNLSAAEPGMKLLDSGFVGGGTSLADMKNGEIMTLLSETGRGDVAEVASVFNAVIYPGRLGQIFEISEASLAVTSVPEQSQTAVMPSFNMTDGTTVADPDAVIEWNPPTGPANMLEDGTVKADAVYQDTPVTLEGQLSGIGFTLGLLVQETIGDNFGIYRHDGIDDAWQVQYFGIDNPEGRGDEDPDGDGQDNFYEFIAGLIPTDPHSRFRLSVAPVPGQPGQKNVIFEPIVAGRSYVVKTNLDLSPASWTTLVGGSVSDESSQRTVTDTAASEPRKFYKVEIVKP